MKRVVMFGLCLFAMAACQETAGTGPALPSGTSAPLVKISKSGADSCGAADFAFLVNQPLANTFDIAMPNNTRYLGRSEKGDGVAKAGRMTIVLSTRQARTAFLMASGTILKVFCG